MYIIELVIEAGIYLSQDMLSIRPASTQELKCPCLPAGHCSEQFDTGGEHRSLAPVKKQIEWPRAELEERSARKKEEWGKAGVGRTLDERVEVLGYLAGF